MEVSVWHHQQIDGAIDMDNTNDHCEQQYPWRRNTTEDGANIHLPVNTSQYSDDSNVESNLAKELRRNVNTVEVNLGYVKSSRKVTRNKDPSLVESRSQIEVSDAYDTMVDNQNLASESISSSQPASNLNLDDDKRSNLDRGSTSTTPKAKP